MIHQICKCYGLDKNIVKKYSQMDFWEMRTFENLEAKIENEQIEKVTKRK